MKIWRGLNIVLFAILSLLVINARAEGGDTVYRAVSLKILQERLKAAQGRGSYPRELIQLSGLTRISGYIIDGDNQDVLLFGEIEEEFPTLNLDDFVVALRNTYLKYAELKGDTYYYKAPYVSIEPDLQMTNSLRDIGREIFEGSSTESVEYAVERWQELCRSPQSVVIKGIPFHSHFAEVLINADYDMKRLAVGCDDPPISGFTSLADMTLEKVRKDFAKKGTVSFDSSIGNRFWFYPGKILFVEDEGIIQIETVQIVLLTEESYLGRTGQIAGQGKTSKTAEAFASRFTSMYNQLADEMSIYLEFENLFNVFALSKALKYKSSPKKATLDMKYLLDKYTISRNSMNKRLPGKPNVKEFKHRAGNQKTRVWIPFCGGVNMDFRLGGRNFRRDKTGHLSRLKRAALDARPKPEALAWDFNP